MYTSILYIYVHCAYLHLLSHMHAYAKFHIYDIVFRWCTHKMYAIPYIWISAPIFVMPTFGNVVIVEITSVWLFQPRSNFQFWSKLMIQSIDCSWCCFSLNEHKRTVWVLRSLWSLDQHRDTERKHEKKKLSLTEQKPAFVHPTHSLVSCQRPISHRHIAQSNNRTLHILEQILCIRTKWIPNFYPFWPNALRHVCGICNACFIWNSIMYIRAESRSWENCDRYLVCINNEEKVDGNNYSVNVCVLCEKVANCMNMF